VGPPWHPDDGDRIIPLLSPIQGNRTAGPRAFPRSLEEPETDHRLTLVYAEHALSREVSLQWRTLWLYLAGPVENNEEVRHEEPDPDCFAGIAIHPFWTDDA
jgi:hypothetical protein